MDAYVGAVPSEAHRHNVIHRDLKPSNIMINKRGEPVIVDFAWPAEGLEKPAWVCPAPRSGATCGHACLHAARTGAWAVQEMGPCSDIYSLGVTLYEMLTGQPPFMGLWTEVMAKVLTEQPPLPSQCRPDLDPALERVCLKAMAKGAGDRFASMADFAAALVDWMSTTTLRPVKGAGSGPAPVPPDPARCQGRAAPCCAPGLGHGPGKIEGDHPRRAGCGGACPLADFARLGGGGAWPLPGSVKTSARGRGLARACLLALAGQAFVACASVAMTLLANSWSRPRPRPIHATPSCWRPLPISEAHCNIIWVTTTRPWPNCTPPWNSSARLTSAPAAFSIRWAWCMPAAIIFQSPRCFTPRSLEVKEAFHDEAGISLSHGQLGRFHLDWGQLDEADKHLREGIQIARRIGDQRGEAQLYNHRGQVMFARGKPAEAGTLIDESIRGARGRYAVIEGYAQGPGPCPSRGG